MHILIVDDHRDFAQTLASLLVESSAIPLTADVAFNGSQAVQFAMARPPVVAFIDVDMPVMNGADAAATIRANMRDKAPLMIAMTGNPDLLTASTLAGVFDRTLCKPVQLSDLLAVTASASTALAPRIN